MLGAIRTDVHSEEVEALFAHDFATMRESEATLADLWFEYHERRIAAAEKIPRDAALAARVRRDLPPPKSIDFRTISDINTAPAKTRSHSG